MKLPLSADSLKPRFNALKERLRPRPKRILVIASDGCHATGAVIGSVDGTRLEIEALATSRALKFEAVAEELVAGLKAQVSSVPKQAILLTASLFPAVLELPVAASKPLPAGQMLEMIRWELEPLSAQQNALWSIGGLLFGRGYLADAQRQALVEAHQAMRTAARAQGGRSATVRFGELAIEKGFVSREQVEECLALQEELRMSDADLLIGWHPDAVGSGRDAGQSAWLCAGIGPTVKIRWVDALERQGLHVRWIYPLAGASAPWSALSHLPAALELHPLLGVCYRQQDGVLAGLSYRQFTATALSASEALALAGPLLRPDDRRLGVYPGRDWEPLLAGTLASELKRDIALLDKNGALTWPANSETPAAMLAALAGGAAHALGLAPSASAVRLPGSKPPPPLYQRPMAWAGAAAILFLAALGGFELNHHLTQRALTARQQALYERQTTLEAAKNEIERSARAEKEARKALETTQTELDNVGLRKQLYERALSQRGRFVESLMDALIDRVNDELLLESVTETGWQRVEVQGFALNAEAVYRYARALAETLGAFGVKLGNLDTGETQGPLELMGYRFSFALLPDGKEGAR
jgi:hypothetical protein